MHETIYAPDYYILEHFGIKGQKWGVRRYQNPDGSLTSAGKKRYLTSDGTHFNAVGQLMIDQSHARLRYPRATKVASAIGGAAGALSGSSSVVLMGLNTGLITASTMPVANIMMQTAPLAGAIGGYLLSRRTLEKDSKFATANWRYDKKMEAKTE